MNTTTHPPIAPVLTFLSEIGVSGNLTIVTKGPIDHLSALDLLEIEEAEELHRAGDTAGAAARVLKIEKRLKITDEDRFAAAKGEPWAGDLEAVLHGLLPAEEGEPDLMTTPHDFRRFNEAEASTIDRYDQIRTIARARGNRKGVAQAEGAMANVARRRDHRVDVKERHDGIAETVALAKNRGEEVEEKPPVGAAIIWSRDGFAELKKHFTVSQVRVGERYRRGFEARTGDLQASQIRDSGGRGHDNNQFVADRFERAHDSAFATRCDREVRLRCITHLSAVQMLQWVVGNGRSLRAFGAGGRAYARNKAALAAALDVAIQVEAEMAEEARKRAAAEKNAGKEA